MKDVTVGRTVDRIGALRLILLGAGASYGGSVLAVLIVGPLARRAFGAPYDYGSDYTSSEALAHAFVVMTGTLIVVFASLGRALRAPGGARLSRPALFCLVNPAAVGAACVALSFSIDGAHVVDGAVTCEYLSPTMWVGQALLTMPIYGPAATLGHRAWQKPTA